MKLTQMISKYHSVTFSMKERDLENDPLGEEADDLYHRIERTKPVDPDDVAALARFARHVIEAEQDPYGAVKMMHNIADWAAFHSGEMEDFEVITQMALDSTRH